MASFSLKRMTMRTATLVHVQVKPEFVDAFIHVTRENHEASIAEPGNLRFDLIQDPGDPSKLILYEVYENQDAAAAHKKTAHYLKWRDTVAPWMASPREGVVYNLLFPEKTT